MILYRGHLRIGHRINVFNSKMHRRESPGNGLISAFFRCIDAVSFFFKVSIHSILIRDQITASQASCCVFITSFLSLAGHVLLKVCLSDSTTSTTMSRMSCGSNCFSSEALRSLMAFSGVKFFSGSYHFAHKALRNLEVVKKVYLEHMADEVHRLFRHGPRFANARAIE